jgi:hypothetical protein
MNFKTHIFDEPLLEFGDGGQHLDPREGLRRYGPLQSRSGWCCPAPWKSIPPAPRKTAPLVVWRMKGVFDDF